MSRHGDRVWPCCQVTFGGGADRASDGDTATVFADDVEDRLGKRWTLAFLGAKTPCSYLDVGRMRSDDSMDLVSVDCIRSTVWVDCLFDRFDSSAGSFFRNKVG